MEINNIIDDFRGNNLRLISFVDVILTIYQDLYSGLLQIYAHLMNNQHYARANSCNTINHVLIDCFISGLKLINTYDRLFSLMCWFFQSGAPKFTVRKHWETLIGYCRWRQKSPTILFLKMSITRGHLDKDIVIQFFSVKCLLKSQNMPMNYTYKVRNRLFYFILITSSLNNIY